MRQLCFFTRFFLFWIILFFLQRLTFLILTASSPGTVTFFDLVDVTRYGLIMDISMASYIIMYAVLVFYLTLAFDEKFFVIILKVSSWILITATSFLVIVDSGLMHAWGTKINAKAISYLAYPEMLKDAALSVSYTKLIFSWILLTTVAFIIWYWIMIRTRKQAGWRDKTWSSAILTILIIPLAIAGARGGFGKFPLGKSRVFFSDNLTLSYGALNSTWNFMEVMLNLGESTKNPYAYYTEKEAEEFFHQNIMRKSDSIPIKLFNQEKPNIVIVLLESFTAENLGYFGGDNNAPNCNSLLDSSLVFTRFYANGYRSEHGLVAILSGFPPLPNYSMQRESNRIIRMPIFTKILKDSLHYSLQYYNTYDIHYARINEYLALSRFDKIVTDQDFLDAKKHQWGVMDEYLFDYALVDLKRNATPFLALIVTSTSHEPFRAEVPQKFKGPGEVNRYRNTIAYTDSCLINFMLKAQKQPWYQNTIFIILADHGHAYPGNRNSQDDRKYHIPLILYGPALDKNFRGKKIDLPVSQIDIPATILGQFGLRYGQFPFSRDMMNPYIYHSAFFTHDDLFGYIGPNNGYTCLLTNGNVIPHRQSATADSTSIKEGKVFLQMLYKRFMEY